MLTEEDEQFMEDYLYGNDISIERIHEMIRKGTVNNRIVPILCGSALKNKGIQLLLDAVTPVLTITTGSIARKR